MRAGAIKFLSDDLFYERQEERRKLAARATEHRRLRSAFILAAKAEYAENPFLQSMASRRFRNAITELENFEAQAKFQAKSQQENR